MAVQWGSGGGCPVRCAGEAGEGGWPNRVGGAIWPPGWDADRPIGVRGGATVAVGSRRRCPLGSRKRASPSHCKTEDSAMLVLQLHYY